VQARGCQLSRCAHRERNDGEGQLETHPESFPPESGTKNVLAHLASGAIFAPRLTPEHSPVRQVTDSDCREPIPCSLTISQVPPSPQSWPPLTSLSPWPHGLYFLFALPLRLAFRSATNKLTGRREEVLIGCPRFVLVAGERLVHAFRSPMCGPLFAHLALGFLTLPLQKSCQGRDSHRNLIGMVDQLENAQPWRDDLPKAPGDPCCWYCYYLSQCESIAPRSPARRRFYGRPIRPARNSAPASVDWNSPVPSWNPATSPDT